jgi:hypothetical protein
MKLTTLTSLVIITTALAVALPMSNVLASSSPESLSLQGQDPEPPQRPGQPGGGGQEGGARAGRQASPLGGHMQTLEAGVEKLAAALDAKDAETKLEELLVEVCQLQRVSLDAKSEAPRGLARMEEKDKDKALVSYRTQMQGLTNALFAVELQLLAKDVKKAKKALAELEQIQAKGHGEFKRGGSGGGGRGR